MAMQTGVAASKVLILVGAGVTGSVILRSGQLSDLISHLQEMIARLNEAEISPGKFDAALLAAQVRQLAKEIKDLSVSNPVTIFNADSSSGNYASYILPTAAVGAMGYCYMWWKGWSFSDVMFVTKHNMASAVESVSKQLENVSEALALTKRHLTNRLENLDWKLDEQREISKLVANDVGEVRSDLNQIGYDIGLIHSMVSGLEGKIELLESKQDLTNSGLWYLCQAAGNVKDGQNFDVIKDVGTKLIAKSPAFLEKEMGKGLYSIIGTNESSAEHKIVSSEDKIDSVDNVAIDKGPPIMKRRIHQSYTVGLSFASGIVS